MSHPRFRDRSTRAQLTAVAALILLGLVSGWLGYRLGFFLGAH